MKFMQPEPLNLSAPLALRLAPGMCRGTAGKDDSCAWSHGFWQYLRLLGMAGDPTNHDAFFVDALVRSLHEKKDPHVLVCGSADYAMLAMLLRAFERLRHRGEVTVVDCCETPLWLNRWYADSMSFPIVTERCDILDMGSDRTFDLICTHSFFSYFEPAQRPGLLRQ